MTCKHRQVGLQVAFRKRNNSTWWIALHGKLNHAHYRQKIFACQQKMGTIYPPEDGANVIVGIYSSGCRTGARSSMIGS